MRPARHARDPQLEESARRMADAINLHVVVGVDLERAAPGWVAVKMADGSTDGVLYDSKVDAQRHHRHQPATFFLAVGRESMSQASALVILRLRRQAYAAGIRFDQDDVITPHRLEQLGQIIPNPRKGLSRP